MVDAMGEIKWRPDTCPYPALSFTKRGTSPLSIYRRRAETSEAIPIPLEVGGANLP